MVQFSFLSFLASSKGEKERVVIMTDYPQYYNRYKDMVTVKAITTDTITEWQGKHHFFWRAKIKAIESVVDEYPEDDIVYLDGDTFFYGDVSEMKGVLKGSMAMMHKDEGHPSAMMTKTLRMWNTIKGHTYAGVTIGMQHNMWNAGVVALPSNKNKEAITLALALCDGMLDDGAEPIVIEQYSLSIALQETYGLTPASPFIGHYWGNKPEWIKLITDRMLAAYMSGEAAMDDVEYLRTIDFSEKPVYAHYSSWRDRLQKRLNNLFPKPKRTEYVDKR